MSAEISKNGANDGSPKIAPCLWFDSQSEDAAKFYVSIFKNSQIDSVSNYGEASAAASGQPEGSVMWVTFTIAGQQFTALNGGKSFQISPAISFVLYCDTQDEIDFYWDKLSAGGQPIECGWVTDKFGVSWQVVPRALNKLWQEGNAKKLENLMRALMTMKNLDQQVLLDAYEQG